MLLSVDVLGLKVDVLVVDVLKIDVLEVVQMGWPDNVHIRTKKIIICSQMSTDVYTLSSPP